MMDSFGNAQNLLLIGGTSEIGLETIFEFAKANRVIKVIVTSQNEKSLIESKQKLIRLGIEIEGHLLDLEDTKNVAKIIKNILNNNQIDICLVAAGYLPNNSEALQNPSEAVRTALINFVGPLAVGTAVMNYFIEQGFGSLIIFSTVAALRPRRDIFVYGASKVALDFWANGYSATINSKAIKIFIVRTGMVRTKMTSGLKEAPFTINTVDVAKAVKRNLFKQKVIIWVPQHFKLIMFIFVKIPGFIFKRINMR
jgi:decaprenylphospho-beta-D-erythro-pentofuranosid-2-ulose 2-reductase